MGLTPDPNLTADVVRLMGLHPEAERSGRHHASLRTCIEQAAAADPTQCTTAGDCTCDRCRWLRYALSVAASEDLHGAAVTDRPGWLTRTVTF